METLRRKVRPARAPAKLATATVALALGLLTQAHARADGAQSLKDAQTLYQSGQYFKAARYAFSAKDDASVSGEAYAWTTLGLAKARLYHAASYFYIKTLQSGNRAAIRRVLGQTQELLVNVGADVFRKYLIRHTQYDDYDAANRSAYLYALGKDALLAGQEEKAIGYLTSVGSNSPLMPYALQLRGTAFAVQGKADRALTDFRSCVKYANEVVPSSVRGTALAKRMQAESEDLEARCLADQARTLYQLDRFEEADQSYDLISKLSIVWPDVLFEQAWNAYARKEFNRTLGKLVSYKSPALSFVFNPEVDVLRAQSYLGLCLYDDANGVVNEFNAKYANVGQQAKRFVEANASNLGAFHDLGKEALRGSLYTNREMHRMVNRFARGPYFQGLVRAEQQLSSELAAIHRFNSSMPGVDADPKKGFPGFLEHVLNWRLRSIRQLGGAFVKNSLLDHHAALLADFDKMSFIKLEMLKRAKESIMSKGKSRGQGERAWGNVEPSRRDYQYYWSFNGEFWNDELGDYVFGLESECGRADGA